MSQPQSRYSSQKNNPTFRRLTDSKLQAKREKGLCFRCDEKYIVGHRCKNMEIHVLVVNDEGGELRPEEEYGIVESLILEIDKITELSINSMVSLSGSKTMKVKGIIA